MIQLTQQMRELIDPALAKGTPCLVATSRRNGLKGWHPEYRL